MDILSVGNSFSEDATRYVHQIARKSGCIMNTANLFIGGCSLEMHAENMKSGEAAYELQYNGENTGFFVSLDEAIHNRNWDFITLQQVSHKSVDYGTYTPYIRELSEYIKKNCPDAKQVIHQTWAYEQNSERLCNELGYADYKEMLSDIKTAYNFAKKEIDAYGIIPSGELFALLLESGISKLHRDTFHASLGVGRYAIGLLWYTFFTNNSIKDISFSDFDEPISAAEISIIKKCIKSLI